MINVTQAFLWLLPFVGFIAGYFVPMLILPSTHQKAPHVVGKPLHEALSILAEHNLNARLIKEIEDPIILPGTVIHQNPSPLQPIKHNQTITLITTKKMPLPQTPHLIQKTPHEIRACLKPSQASVDYISIPSAHKAPYCLAQYPNEHESLVSKRIIAYMSVDRKQWYIMPNFVHQPYIQVDEYLKSFSLKHETFVGAVKTMPEQINQHAIITEQKPAAGSIIDIHNPPCIQFHINK